MKNAEQVLPGIPLNRREASVFGVGLIAVVSCLLLWWANEMWWSTYSRYIPPRDNLIEARRASARAYLLFERNEAGNPEVKRQDILAFLAKARRAARDNVTGRSNLVQIPAAPPASSGQAAEFAAFEQAVESFAALTEELLGSAAGRADLLMRQRNAFAQVDRLSNQLDNALLEALNTSVRNGQRLRNASLAAWLAFLVISCLLLIRASRAEASSQSLLQAEQRALKESEQRFRATFEQAAVGISHVAPDGQWLLVNERLCEIVGYSREELLARSFQDITHPEDLKRDLTLLEELIAGKKNAYAMEKRYIRKDGSSTWINLTVALVRQDDGSPHYFISVVEDINRRKAAEARLAESLAQLRQFAEIGSDYLWEQDADLRLRFISPAISTRSGLDHEKYLGLRNTDLPWVKMDEAAWRQYTAIQGSHQPFRNQLLALENRAGETRWLEVSGDPLVDADGHFAGYRGVAQDVTAKRRAEAEIRRLNETLEHEVEARTAELRAANQELDAFAYAVSHDLRAPLRAMNGFSQALLEDYGPTLKGDGQTYLNQIILASRHMGDLIDGLLVLSRSTRNELTYETVDLSALATRILTQLNRQAPGSATQWSVEPGIRVRGDTRMLGAMMENLLNNAWKYSSKVAQPHIRVYLDNSGDTPVICVADNGAGFDMAHAAKLFQPFQRLHRQDEFTGTGVGLATVQRIISRHGGSIDAVAAPGRGATFRLTLPMAEPVGEPS